MQSGEHAALTPPDEFTSSASKFVSWSDGVSWKFLLRELYNNLITFHSSQHAMALGEKLFDEIGKTVGFKITRVHPVEGITMEMSFVSDITGAGRVPNGKNMGSGVMTQYPHGVVDASYQGTFTTAQGEQFMWWAHEKSRVVEGGKVKGLVIVTGFSNSQGLSWMNNVIIAIDSEYDPAAQQFKGTAYEWK
jgi:hypothetical protein